MKGFDGFGKPSKQGGEGLGKKLENTKRTWA